MGHSEAAPFPWLGSASLVVEMSKTLCVDVPHPHVLSPYLRRWHGYIPCQLYLTLTHYRWQQQFFRVAIDITYKSLTHSQPNSSKQHGQLTVAHVTSARNKAFFHFWGCRHESMSPQVHKHTVHIVHYTSHGRGLNNLMPRHLHSQGENVGWLNIFHTPEEILFGERIIESMDVPSIPFFVQPTVSNDHSPWKHQKGGGLFGSSGIAVNHAFQS